MEEERLKATPAELVGMLKEAWEAHDYRIRGMFGESAGPIARTCEDQTSTTDNPLWDIVRWFPAEQDWRGGLLRPDMAPMFTDKTWMHRLLDVGCTRHTLCKTFAYSIPSPGDLTWIKQVLDGRAVVETGAGSGYWAWQLEQSGIDVAAYDPYPVGEGNVYCTAGPHTTVLRDDASAAKHHTDRALLLVWPPYDEPVAEHALSVYEGDLLLYAGEGSGGCTGGDGFHDLLEREWEEIAVAPKHVTYSGIHCRLAAYRRSGVVPES